MQFLNLCFFDSSDFIINLIQTRGIKIILIHKAVKLHKIITGMN